ncbi:hypothetical protein BYT27DRAFT_7205352 [Phlegmacium glaucopus]|nr:hypothetical protein BYT27DRAFT_7205352 [Phlegmacium glaucopus]
MSNINPDNTAQNLQRLYTPPPPPLSARYSTPGVQNSFWCSQDFMLGAGMILIQENTHKIVVVYETQKKAWFFPRGRKDIGESLEQTALREAYEESGYHAEFMPLFSPHHAPTPPHQPDAHERPNVEPIFVSLRAWQPKRRRRPGTVDNGGEYLTTWYVGRIAENAVQQKGTGMPDEQNYESHLLSIDEAMRCISAGEQKILQYAWEVYCFTVEELERQRSEAERATSLRVPT